MKSPLHYMTGLTLTVACAVAVAGCGDDVPSGAVAKVNDTVITKDQFDHWLGNAAKAQQQGGPPVAPDSPRFTKCVAALRDQQAKGAKSADGELKKQCKQSYEQLKQQVMRLLIQSQWIQQEAEKRDVSVSGKEVRTLFEDQKKQEFQKEEDYRKFLRASGVTEQDILFQIKLGTLQDKLFRKIQKEQEKVTDEDVEQYYEKSRSRFAQPERRDLNVVLTKTKARAERAKKQLDGGASFKAVSRELSIDRASRAQDGKMPGVAQGQQQKPFDEAIFEAEKGEVEGPVKTQFGWYVFEVTKVTPEDRQSLEQSQEAIRGILKSEREQKSLQDFVKDFREDYRDETNCADDFIVPECSNAPEESTSTVPASGSNPGAPASPQDPAAPGAPAPQQPTP